MPEFVQFDATTPSVTPATQEVVYDKYWLSTFRVEAGNPTQKIRLVAVFTPARDVTVKDEDGKDVVVKELMPNAEPKRLVIQDLFAEAVADPTGFGATINAVFALLKTKAESEGIL
jgi:hypothetical protein